MGALLSVGPIQSPDLPGYGFGDSLNKQEMLEGIQGLLVKERMLMHLDALS